MRLMVRRSINTYGALPRDVNLRSFISTYVLKSLLVLQHLACCKLTGAGNYRPVSTQLAVLNHLELQ